jgi:hypothetical protein
MSRKTMLLQELLVMQQDLLLAFYWFRSCFNKYVNFQTLLYVSL